MSELPTAKLVKVYGKKVWIEECPITGAKHVMVQHDAPGEEPFCYASFHYDYRHTGNSTVHFEATRIALSLGATDPVETRNRDWPKLSAPVQASEARELLDAYDVGWIECTNWAKRDDLVADMDSPAYAKARARNIAALSAHTQAGPVG